MPGIGVGGPGAGLMSPPSSGVSLRCRISLGVKGRGSLPELVYDPACGDEVADPIGRKCDVGLAVVMLAGSVNLSVSFVRWASGERLKLAGMRPVGPRSSFNAGAAEGMLIGDDGRGMFAALSSNDMSFSRARSCGTLRMMLRPLMLPTMLLAMLDLGFEMFGESSGRGGESSFSKPAV